MATENKYVEAFGPDDLRIRGTRVGIEHVLSEYLSGRLPEEIAVEFPTVSLEQIHGVIAYYLGNRQHMDAYLERWESQARKARRDQSRRPSPDVVLRLRQLAQERAAV